MTSPNDTNFGYSLPVHGRGRIPPPQVVVTPDSPLYPGRMLLNRRSGRLLPHVRIERYNATFDTVRVRIDDEAFPEFWCEVNLKRVELETVLPPPAKKQRTEEPIAWKGQSHRGLCEQFFTYKESLGADKHVTAMFYGDCTLVTDLGDFKAGAKFHEISVDLKWSKMDLYVKDRDEPVATFSLELMAKRCSE